MSVQHVVTSAHRSKRLFLIAAAAAVASFLFAEFSLPGGLARRLWGKGSDDPGVRVLAEREGAKLHLVLSTVNCLDITLTLHASQENTRGSRLTPFTVATRGATRTELATFEPADPAKPWDFRYRFSWLYGCPGGVHDHTVYELPFDPASSHRLLQGPHGSFSHEDGSGSEYAHDWDLDEGSVVLAARGGVVVGVREDSTAHGVGQRFGSSANYVIIRHTDGTYGEYLHLQPGGATVNLNDAVKAGDPIALSGNTGYSSRPHLHFGVFRIRESNTRESLPFRVRTKDGVREVLETGKLY